MTTASCDVIHLTCQVLEDQVVIDIDPLSPKRTRPSYRAGGILRTRCDMIWKYAVIHGHASEKWGFPKGRRRKEESELGCALREIREEIGLVDLYAPTDILTCRAKDEGVYYLFDVSTTLPLHPKDTNEIKDAQWMSLDEIRLLPCIKVVNKLIRKLECLE